MKDGDLKNLPGKTRVLVGYYVVFGIDYIAATC
jgi:hypothetical protein